MKIDINRQIDKLDRQARLTDRHIKMNRQTNIQINKYIYVQIDR